MFLQATAVRPYGCCRLCLRSLIIGDVPMSQSRRGERVETLGRVRTILTMM